MKKFIFPGSFDPFTNGHKAIVDQTYKLCDEFIIALATNLKFVKKCVDISFKIDDIVLYETRLYRITDINYITGICSLHEVYANKEISRVGYHRLKPVTFYYFINSAGQISSSYIGKDPAADSWRALTNNLFYTKDEVVKYRDSILKKKI